VEYDVRRTAVRFALGVAIVAALLYGVGWEQVLANLQQTDLVVLAPAFACTLLAMVVGCDGLRIVFGLPFRGATSSLARRAYLSSWFINSVFPGGSVGAGAFVAYTMRRADEDGVGGSVASVASWEFLNMVASAVVATAGVAGVAASGGETGVAPVALAVFVALLAAAGVLVVLFGTRRERVVDVLVWLAGLSQRTLGRAVPALDVAHTREAISGGLDSFFADVEALAADRRRLALALVLAHLGWLFGALPLYFAMHAVGLSVSLAVVLVVIPLSGFAMAVPVPGGLGAMDAALGALVVFFTGYSLGAVASAVVLYRVAKYPLQVLVGGLALWSLSRAG
jgi:uncharacterized protein (TIRG00374 family)